MVITGTPATAAPLVFIQLSIWRKRQFPVGRWTFRTVIRPLYWTMQLNSTSNWRSLAGPSRLMSNACTALLTLRLRSEKGDVARHLRTNATSRRVKRSTCTDTAVLLWTGR